MTAFPSPEGGAWSNADLPDRTSGVVGARRPDEDYTRVFTVRSHSISKLSRATRNSGGVQGALSSESVLGGV